MNVLIWAALVVALPALGALFKALVWEPLVDRLRGLRGSR